MIGTAKQEYIENRIIEEARYIIANKSTVRKTADQFKLGKSTIHEDMSYKLKKINYNMYLEVKEILDFNLADRCYRKGRKYLESLQGKQIC